MGVITPEGKVKQFIKKYMKSEFPNAWQYCPMGGAFGKSGVPDFLYLIDGLLLGIEAKAEQGKLSQLQELTMKQMVRQGAICAVVYGKDTAKMDRIRDAVIAELKKRGVEQ